jgi:hypothetical protein
MHSARCLRASAEPLDQAACAVGRTASTGAGFPNPKGASASSSAAVSTFSSVNVSTASIASCGWKSLGVSRSDAYRLKRSRNSPTRVACNDTPAA